MIIKLHNRFALLFICLLYSGIGFAQMHNHDLSEPMSPSDCPEEKVWDFETANCQPLAMKDMKMSMWMFHGNAFLVQNVSEGKRGRNRFSVPNMLMGDIGTSVESRHYINLNIMLTFEKWTFPSDGYPELYQIGEVDENDRLYIDGQHPHSSPIMGLTLSDTIRLNDGKDHLKVFFAPRGQATEGPIAFMHRATGMFNPDAPLGHHIGQDISHITSTVVGASLGLSKFHIEASVFNGEEPEPTKVDLPIGKINSFAGRLIYEFSNSFYMMASASRVKDPEPHDPTIDEVLRYSTSSYYQKKFSSGWMFHNSLIFGLVSFYDHIASLRSVNEEFVIHSMDLPHNYWGRFEMVERTASQLGIALNSNPEWVKALTAGYTYDLWKMENAKVGLGASVTQNFSPQNFESAYGSRPLAGKVFIQLMGMKMGSL